MRNGAKAKSSRPRMGRSISATFAKLAGIFASKEVCRGRNFPLRQASFDVCSGGVDSIRHQTQMIPGQRRAPQYARVISGCRKVNRRFPARNHADQLLTQNVGEAVG